MCGLAGAISFDTGRPVDRRFLVAAAEAMRHRGPDDQHVEMGANWGLAFRRLSILDRSARGRQPMTDDAGQCWLVFNGEIYNFRELRGELEALGARFDSSGDAQVLLQALKTWGKEAIPRLNGMFAIAFLDLRRRTLLLARDRLGQKPLLYFRDQSQLLFASELSAFRLARGVEARVDPVAVSQYFGFNYVPSPRTILRDVWKVPPGHCLEVPLDRPSAAEPRPYWELRFHEEEGRSADVCVDAVAQALEDAVRLRLVSDVPVGTLLSGGLDSGLITAMAAGGDRPDLVAFTVGFREDEWDESGAAADVARHYGMEHRVGVMETDAWQVLPELVRYYGEPFADSSAVPTYSLCRMAAEHATVFLSGDGGDEAFAGYRRYQSAQSMRWLDRIPLPARRVASAMLSKLLPREHLYHRRALKLGLPNWQRAFAHSVFADDPMNLLPLSRDVAVTHEQLMEPLLSLEHEIVGLPLMSMLQYLDYRLYLSNDILVKVDRASMAHSIEVRSPFLDHRLVELAARIPPRLQVGPEGGKAMLRPLAETYLPSGSLKLPKQGFGIPFSEWFRGPALDEIQEILTDPAVEQSGLYDPDAVRRLLHLQRVGARDFSHDLWRLMFFQEWYRGFSEDIPSGLAA